MLNWLPLLFLLACPVMMLFMMRGMSGTHGAHDNDHNHQTRGTSADTDAREARLVELEREVAGLRAERERTGVRGL